MKKFFPVIIVVGIGLLLGCGRVKGIKEEVTETPVPTPLSTSTPTPTLPPTPTPTPIPTPTSVPTPMPLPEGDFSDTFPAESTGEAAHKSYQSEDVRVAIHRVAKKGVTYFVADIWIRNIDYLRTALGRGKYGGGRQPMTTLMKKNDALLALSGDYYGAREKGVVIRNGERYRDTPHVDVCVLYRNGEMKTYTSEEWTAIENTEKGVYQAWGFGPMLLDQNSMPMVLEQFNGFEYEKRHPRAAIGYYEPGHYCFVLVDGREPGYSKGMLLSELSTLFYELGCRTAYNLDGGATAILAYKGEYVNKPSSGGRSQYDIIYIARPRLAKEKPLPEETSLPGPSPTLEPSPTPELSLTPELSSMLQDTSGALITAKHQNIGVAYDGSIYV